MLPKQIPIQSLYMVSVMPRSQMPACPISRERPTSTGRVKWVDTRYSVGLVAFTNERTGTRGDSPADDRKILTRISADVRTTVCRFYPPAAGVAAGQVPKFHPDTGRLSDDREDTSRCSADFYLMRLRYPTSGKKTRKPS